MLTVNHISSSVSKKMSCSVDLKKPISILIAISTPKKRNANKRRERMEGGVISDPVAIHFVFNCIADRLMRHFRTVDRDVGVPFVKRRRSSNNSAKLSPGRLAMPRAMKSPILLIRVLISASKKTMRPSDCK